MDTKEPTLFDTNALRRPNTRTLTLAEVQALAHKGEIQEGARTITIVQEGDDWPEDASDDIED